MEKRYLTEGLQPANVLRHFEDICAIPHGSGNEAALEAHIVAFARANGLTYECDEAGNILVTKPASRGIEGAPALLLQGHMDMVLAKRADVTLDMAREPVHLVLEGNILRAEGTSLGADNAVGLCNMLALMEDAEHPHPPLEFLFTTGEEAGMTGIRRFDFLKLRARRMITMDCGDPDCMVIGSAGSARYALTRNAPLRPFSGHALRFEIGGLLGGHPGIEAGKNRMSAVALAGRLLCAIADALPVQLVEITMAETGAGIPREMAFTVGFAPEEIARVREIALGMDAAFRAQAMGIDPDYRLCVYQAQAHAAVSPQDTRAVIDLMRLIPNGVLRHSEHNPAWPLCSALLGRAVLEGGTFRGIFSIRANRDEYRDDCVSQLETLLRLTHAQSEFLGGAPAWPLEPVSPLQTLCGEVYQKLFGMPMHAEPVHGAVEAGIIKRALPQMDIVGFSPKSRGAHTSDERLYVDSMLPFWNYLTALLRAMCAAPSSAS